ncbi:hypothetical protein WA026_021622 [Henosepilachna vigintioctopunctata]|uniref:Uncharacterized protein n=1 Tax=Henosepilachna vigintioctopunctata TaxID=420089 RepID=A0AAW1V3E2_9CUCU
MNDFNKKVAASTSADHKNTKYIFIPLLIFLVVSSLSLSILSVWDLQWEDRISLETGSMLFIYGLIFFTASYEVSNHLFFYTNTGRKLIKKFGLSKGFVKEISNKNVSAIQALFCCITGLTSTCYSCTRDMLRTSHYISEAYAWFGAAYFLYDICSMYKVQVAVCEDERLAELTNGNAHNGATPLHSTRSLEGVNRGTTFWSSFIYFLRTNPVIVGHHVFVGGFGFLVITHLRGD